MIMVSKSTDGYERTYINLVFPVMILFFLSVERGLDSFSNEDRPFPGAHGYFWANGSSQLCPNLDWSTVEGMDK